MLIFTLYGTMSLQSTESTILVNIVGLKFSHVSMCVLSGYKFSLLVYFTQNCLFKVKTKLLRVYKSIALFLFKVL